MTAMTDAHCNREEFFRPMMNEENLYDWRKYQTLYLLNQNAKSLKIYRRVQMSKQNMFFLNLSSGQKRIKLALVIRFKTLKNLKRKELKVAKALLWVDLIWKVVYAAFD